MNQSEQVTDWVEVLLRDYQDKLTHGPYEAIYRLGDASVDALMEGQARTCVRAFAVLAGLPAPMDLDAFLQTMRTAGPSRIEIRREGGYHLLARTAPGGVGLPSRAALGRAGPQHARHKPHSQFALGPESC